MPTPSVLTFGCCGALLALSGATALAQTTLAHWNFDFGSIGMSLAALPVTDLSGNAHIMHGYNDLVSPLYSGNTATGTGLSIQATVQDGYTLAAGVNQWSPLAWTIEVSVRMQQIDGWRTIIGRDGSSWPGNPKSDFYFQKNGLDDRFRLDFATVDGGRYMVESHFPMIAGQWYHVALVSDGKTVSMYIDQLDGQGYRLSASTPLGRRPDSNNALASNGANWIFGRGWYAEKHADHIDGNIDDVRFTDGALPPERFLHAAAGRAALPGVEIARSGADVSMTWRLPAGPVSRIDIHRHFQSEPEGRQLVATIYPPREVYLERVPEAATTYWYWLVATAADGKVSTYGPVASLPAEIWQP
jgi:hypothetical protein